MCYQYPFAVSPVVVPAPESHRSVSIPLGTLVSFSESRGILRRGIISPPDGYSVVNVQAPSLVRTGKGALGGCFSKKVFIPHLFGMGWPFCSGVLKTFFISPSTCSHWEGRFGGVFFKKVYFPSLVPTGKPALVGCFAKKFIPPLVRTGKAVFVMLF